MSAVLTTPVACKLAEQLLATTTGAALDLLAHEWFGARSDTTRRGRPDDEFRLALAMKIGRIKDQLEPRTIHNASVTVDQDGARASFESGGLLSHDEWRAITEAAGVRVDSDIAWLVDRIRAKFDAETIIAYDLERPSPASDDVHSAIRSIGDKPHHAPTIIQALAVPRDYIVAREQLGRLLDTITPDEQVARCMDPVSTVAEVDAAIDVVVRLREPAAQAPATGLEGWAPRAVQGDGGVWTEIGGSVWVKWARGERGVTTSRAWEENGRVSKTEGDVTPADRVALEEAWAGEQRTRLVGSTLKDDQPAVTKDQWVESKWRDCVSREGGSDRTEAQARCVASNAWVDRWHLRLEATRRACQVPFREVSGPDPGE